MPRTNVIDVRKIITTGLVDDEVTAYISSATVFVDDYLGDSALSEATLTEIEKWVTAHFIASTRSRQLSEGEAGPVKASYQGKTGMGLYSTHYGQNAISLDSSGTLADIGDTGRKQFVTFAVDEPGYSGVPYG